MGKRFTTKISNFSGGISDDVRQVSGSEFSISKHFDIFTNPKKLIPHRSVEAESVDGLNIGNFLYNSNSELCALGKDVGASVFEIYYKSGASIVTDNFSGGKWTGSTGVAQYEVFIEFNSKMYLCIYAAPNYKLTSALVASPYTINENVGTLAGKPTGPGFIHSKSNILFIPTGNKINKLTSAGSFEADCAPSISSDYVITSLAEWGSYLAIGCYSSVTGGSKVIIWDMVTTTTFLDIIDWGSDALFVLNNLEGYLIGVSCTLYAGLTTDLARVSIKSWSGGKPSLIKEITAPKLVMGTPTASLTGSSGTSPIVNFVRDGKLYFYAKVSGGTSPSPTYLGLFVIGRKNVKYPFAVTLDRFATTDNSETSIWQAFFLGDYCWFVHSDVGTVTRTDDQANYASTSVYESQKFNGEAHGYDSSDVKNLLEASLTCDKLPTDATAKLYYRVDGATDWTLLLTISSVNRLSEFINKTIGDYKEIEWKIESYKGAVITGFSFTEEIKGKIKQ